MFRCLTVKITFADPFLAFLQWQLQTHFPSMRRSTVISRPVAAGSSSLSLGFGVNTVTGSFFQRPEGLNELADLDSFRFTIPKGLALTGITYAFETTGTGTVAVASFYLDWAPGDGLDVISRADIDLFGNQSNQAVWRRRICFSNTYDVGSGALVRSSERERMGCELRLEPGGRYGPGARTRLPLAPRPGSCVAWARGAGGSGRHRLQTTLASTGATTGVALVASGIRRTSALPCAPCPSSPPTLTPGCAPTRGRRLAGGVRPAAHPDPVCDPGGCHRPGPSLQGREAAGDR